MGTLITADERFLALGNEIPPLANIPSHFSFASWRRSADYIYLSGHGPNGEKMPPEFDYCGQVGGSISVEDGYKAARLTGLSLLVTLRSALSSLNRVRQIVEVIGVINSAPNLISHSQVLNGCTDMLRDVFGEAGCGVRMVFGAATLPFNMAVEIKMTVEVS